MLPLQQTGKTVRPVGGRGSIMYVLKNKWLETVFQSSNREEGFSKRGLRITNIFRKYH